MTPITYETVLQWADHEAGPLCMDKDYQTARRLLEAAPELLVALIECVEWMEGLRVSGDAGNWDWSDDEYTRACEAITKATGEQP